MHISSLPSPFGIGTFGKTAYEFVDFVAQARHRYWQVLPLGPTTYGDSPYQSYSAFAGNPYFISLDELVKEGVLTAEDTVSRIYINFCNPWSKNASSTIAATTDPEMFMVGGGVARAGDVLFNPLREHFKTYAFSSCRETPIVAATLGNDAGIYGAVRLIVGE